jgi:hypothetical protein
LTKDRECRIITQSGAHPGVETARNA